MRVKLLLLLIFVIFYSPSFEGQESKMQREQELKVRGVVGSLIIEKQKSTNYIRVGLHYELTNAGSTPIIFWKPSENLNSHWNESYVFAGLTISRTSTFAPEDILDSYSGGSSVNTSSKWVKARKNLDQASPQSDSTTIILPNQSLFFDSDVTIVCNQERSDSIPEHPTFNELKEVGTIWVRACYEAWSPNLEPNQHKNHELKFGRMLQQRWKNFGRLWINDLCSEPIQLNLNTATYKTSEH
jgi:hypothetical protein